jgi:uncharacterized membrane protein YfcA
MLAFDLWQTIGIAAIIFFATFFQSATGFGFGMMAMAILPLFLPFTAVSMALALLGGPMLAVNFFARWRHFHLRPVFPLIIGVVLGVAPGVYILAEWDEGVLMRILGVILVATAIFRLLEDRANGSLAKDKEPELQEIPMAPKNRRCLGPVCGFVSGILGGAFNTGGPPVIYYLYARPWPPQTIIATLQGLFLITAVLKVVLGAGSEILDREATGIAVTGAVPMIAGLYLGIRLSSRLPARWLRAGAFIFCGLVGLKLAIFG